MPTENILLTMADLRNQRNLHLLRRATFGPSEKDYLSLHKRTTKEWTKQLLEESSDIPEALDVVPAPLKAILERTEQQGRSALTEEEKRMIREQLREGLKSLNLTWLKEMTQSKQQLREKMAFFWHGHFACRNNNVVYQQQLLQIIRTHALGNFGTLLKEVSKSAAMINFLNNNQNRKDHPNENFAREVMELFTMGRGYYTETDIKEAARAFTGWNNQMNGDFIFRKFQHDYGNKSILGDTGNFDGDDVLNILLKKKETSVFICRKLYRFLVSDEVNEQNVMWMADRFFKSHYDIASLLKDIFSSDWFYEPANQGAKIKSPIELIVGIQRELPLEWKKPEGQLLMQRLLGQMLFYPPNVAGWPGGKNWIDSSSLMLRLRIPQLIFGLQELYMNPKADDDQMMGMMERSKNAMGRLGGQLLHADIHWDERMKRMAEVPREKLAETLCAQLLYSSTPIDTSIVARYADASSREAFIKTLTIQLMSSPEYQLC